MATRKRTQARSLALQALCAYEGIGDAFTQQLIEFLRDDHVLEDLEIESPPDLELIRFARRLAQDAWNARAKIDKLLSDTSAHWSVERMTPVDRNILRMGLFELLEETDTPIEVVINEAIDLSKRFGDVDSPSFVNGVLDAVRRHLPGAADAPDSTTAVETQPGSAMDDTDPNPTTDDRHGAV